MYDAIPANQEALVQSLDLEMEKFLPMLQDSNLTHANASTIVLPRLVHVLVQ